MLFNFSSTKIIRWPILSCVNSTAKSHAAQDPRLDRERAKQLTSSCRRTTRMICVAKHENIQISFGCSARRVVHHSNAVDHSNKTVNAMNACVRVRCKAAEMRRNHFEWWSCGSFIPCRSAWCAWPTEIRCFWRVWLFYCHPFINASMWCIPMTSVKYPPDGTRRRLLHSTAAAMEIIPIRQHNRHFGIVHFTVNKFTAHAKPYRVLALHIDSGPFVRHSIVGIQFSFCFEFSRRQKNALIWPSCSLITFAEGR